MGAMREGPGLWSTAYWENFRGMKCFRIVGQLEYIL